MDIAYRTPEDGGRPRNPTLMTLSLKVSTVNLSRLTDQATVVTGVDVVSVWTRTVAARASRIELGTDFDHGGRSQKTTLPQPLEARNLKANTRCPRSGAILALAFIDWSIKPHMF